MIVLPYASGTFTTVTQDPGWEGREKGCNGYSGVKGYDVDARSQYKSTMLLADIESAGHEVLRVAQRRVHHWLWCTDLFLEEGCRLIERWGLRRKRTFVWVKTTPELKRSQKGLEQFSREQVAQANEVLRAIDIPGKPYSRTGHWSKMGHEYLIFSTNDPSFRLLNAKFEPSVFFAPVPGGQHSAKPTEAYELIARNSPGPRLAVYERTHRPGFECWGNEMEAVS